MRRSARSDDSTRQLVDVTPGGVFGSHVPIEEKIRSVLGRGTRAKQWSESLLIAPREKDFHRDHNKCDCQPAGGQKQMKEQNVNDDWSEYDQSKRDRNSS